VVRIGDIYRGEKRLKMLPVRDYSENGTVYVLVFTDNPDIVVYGDNSIKALHNKALSIGLEYIGIGSYRSKKSKKSYHIEITTDSMEDSRKLIDFYRKKEAFWTDIGILIALAIVGVLLFWVFR
jgi:hypothetical protein